MSIKVLAYYFSVCYNSFEHTGDKKNTSLHSACQLVYGKTYACSLIANV